MCVNHFVIHLQKVFNVFFNINLFKESDSNFTNNMQQIELEIKSLNFYQRSTKIKKRTKIL